MAISNFRTTIIFYLHSSSTTVIKQRKLFVNQSLTVNTDIPCYSQIVSIIGTIRGMKWNLDFTYHVGTAQFDIQKSGIK